MVKTIKEFKDEVKMIRREMYRKGQYADAKLVASWLDRLLISLEKVAPKLDLMMLDIEELNKAVDACTCSPGKGAKKKRAKKTKKVKKKTGKKAKKKKR